MVRKLLATTAMAAFMAAGMATGVSAQTAPAQPSPGMTAPVEAAPMVKKAEGHLASAIIGETVYSGSGDGAENIGSVNDIVIGPDGQMRAIVVGVGGFLGIGQKNVALEYDLAKWVERDNDEFIVVETTADALKALPEFDLAAYKFGPADAQVGQTEPATAEDLSNARQATAVDPNTAPPASDTMAQAPATTAPATTAPATTDTAQAPAAEERTDNMATAAIDRSNLNAVETGQISADNFIGTTVYGANDENVGEVSDVVLAANGGGVDAVILDVGGFLGIGEKQVALGLDNLTFMSDSAGKMYVYTNLSKEQLEAQAAYDETGYAANRDTMRIIVPN